LSISSIHTYPYPYPVSAVAHILAADVLLAD